MREIVNVSRNWAIGKNGDLMIRIPEDMKFFRTTTRGKMCIMGSTTLASFPGGRPLKNRINIVLIDDPSKISEEAIAAAEADRRDGKTTELIYVSSPEEALEVTSNYSADDVYVIGGASVYRLMLPYCDTCLVTHNDLSDEGAQVYYPDLASSGEWELTEEGEEKEWEGVHFRFCTYRRK